MLKLLLGFKSCASGLLFSRSNNDFSTCYPSSLLFSLFCCFLSSRFWRQTHTYFLEILTCPGVWRTHRSWHLWSTWTFENVYCHSYQNQESNRNGSGRSVGYHWLKIKPWRCERAWIDCLRVRCPTWVRIFGWEIICIVMLIF